jgi:hypothetical protein
VEQRLRIYRVSDPGRWLDEWRERVAPLRRAHGFEILGAWLDEDERTFVWLLAHDDYAAADAAYYASPERAALDPDPARLIVEARELRVHRVD